jgi:hypothetical protein
MAALHTLHRAGQWLRVLAGDRTGRRTAVVTPLALIPVLLDIPLLAALGCVHRRKGHDHKSTRSHQQPVWMFQGHSKSPEQTQKTHGARVGWHQEVGN